MLLGAVAMAALATLIGRTCLATATPASALARHPRSTDEPLWTLVQSAVIRRWFPTPGSPAPSRAR